MAPGDAAEPSAFDQLYQRLVVQGRTPPRKLKKLKKTKPVDKQPPPPRASAHDGNEAVVHVIEDNQPQVVAHEQQRLPIVSPSDPPAHVDVGDPIAPEATACVRRLKLCRNMRRMLLTSKGMVCTTQSLVRILAGNPDHPDRRAFIQQLRATNAGTRRRHRRTMLSTPPPLLYPHNLRSLRQHSRRFMRVEAIAARLFQRLAPLDQDATTTVSSQQRVLHDFRFSAAASPSFQSRIHYTSNPTYLRREAVPLPPATLFMA